MEKNWKASSPQGDKRRAYTVEFKTTVVKYAQANSGRSAAKKFNVDERRVREWRQQFEALSEIKKKSGGAKKMRLEGGGRKITNLDLEEDVLNWIHKRSANMLRVSCKLMRKAKAIHDGSIGNDPAAQTSFVASCGWLEKFMKRNCLSLRRKTITAQKDPSHMIDKFVAYMLQI